MARETSGEATPAGKRSLAWALRCTLALTLPFLCLLPCAYALPRVALDGSFAVVCLALTHTGGARGIPLALLAALALLVSRPEIPWRRRTAEALLVVLALGGVFGAAAYANEFLVKERLAVPRPSVRELANEGLLGLSPEAFYALGDKDARRAYLAERLRRPEVRRVLAVRPAVLAHWAHETGYSFPSGHSLASMSFATCFLALGFALAGGWRRRVLSLLPLWALGVCFTRVLLRVHSPTDVTVGGVLGAGLGLLAFLAAWGLLRRWAPNPDPRAEANEPCPSP
ncbi:MAG: phosphatase PAP2 family protein [Planctomycetota bacterium]|nr:MAG: phosphatase PAP2 family protein [Planctomycetota bacterium]